MSCKIHDFLEKFVRSPLIVVLLWGIQVQGVVAATQTPADRTRYAEIQRLIKKNRHLGGHLTLAVDTRTIKAARAHIGERDIPVLVRMMGDKDYGVASAASGLLVTLGKRAEPALLKAAQGQESSIASQARDALRLLEVCYGQARDVRNKDVCPFDDAIERPDSGGR